MRFHTQSVFLWKLRYIKVSVKVTPQSYSSLLQGLVSLRRDLDKPGTRQHKFGARQPQGFATRRGIDWTRLSSNLAVGQNQWYHFGIGAQPIFVYFSGDWDAHWGYGILTHGHLKLRQQTNGICNTQSKPEKLACGVRQADAASWMSLLFVSVCRRQHALALPFRVLFLGNIWVPPPEQGVSSLVFCVPLFLQRGQRQH